MPIKSTLRPLYPDNWKEISNFVRFYREKGTCQRCGRRHGELVARLSDGRWFDSSTREWRDGHGNKTKWPDIFDYQNVRITKVILAAAHKEHDPRINGEEPYPTLAAWCQRCHLIHDLPFHVIRRKITLKARLASGDLFFGDYRNENFLLIPKGYVAFKK
jgi:hypothetical protein